MEIGNCVKYLLKKKGVSKTWLYQALREGFSQDEFNYSYGAFTTRLSSNNLSATELISIAAILEMDLNQLVEWRKQFKNERAISQIEDEDCLPQELEHQILQHSSACNWIQQVGVHSKCRLISITKRSDKNFYVIFFANQSPDKFIGIVEKINLKDKTLQLVAQYIGTPTKQMKYLSDLAEEQGGLISSQWSRMASQIEEKGCLYAIMYPRQISFDNSTPEDI